MGKKFLFSILPSKILFIWTYSKKIHFVDYIRISNSINSLDQHLALPRVVIALALQLCFLAHLRRRPGGLWYVALG